MTDDKPQAYAPGVYGIPGKAVNVFVLDDADSGVTVIDTGMPGWKNSILALIESIGRTPQDVKHILVTHADIDHVGSLKPLADATGAAIYASAESATYIQHRKSPPHVGFPMSLFSQVLGFFTLRAVAVNHVVADGDTLDIAGGIRVIATPGHTSDHVSYWWERERVLFTGDLFNSWGNELKLTPERITWDMRAAQQSARSTLALNPAVICPGHGKVWKAENEPDRIGELLAMLPEAEAAP